MRWLILGLALAALPATVVAQLPAARDTGRTRNDTLTRPPIRLVPVTVTAAPTLPQQPATSVHVTQAAIQQTPAFDSYDLIRQTAGVEVHDQGQGPGFASDASVRGYSSDHSTDIATWVDGVPLNESVNGHAEGYDDWNILFPEAIQSVDVIKGPTSAVYGNFAFSGIVNIRTIEQMKGTDVWLDPASYGRGEGGLLGGFGNDTTHGVLGLRAVHEDGWRAHSSYDILQGHTRVVHQFSPTTTIDGGVELYATQWHSPGFLDDSQFTARDYNVVTNSTDHGWKLRGQERLSLRVILGPSLAWRTTAYATQGSWKLLLTIPAEPGTFEGGGGQTEEDDRRLGAGLTSALTWALPRGEITLGTAYDWAHSSYQNWNTTNAVRTDANALIAPAVQGEASLFAQASEDITRHLRATLGVRFDHQSTSDTPDSSLGPGMGTIAQPVVKASKSIFAPKFGLLYRLPLGLDLYGNISRGFRQSDGVIEDPTLPYITMWAYETGLKLTSGVVSGSVALFRDDVSNDQTLNPVTLEDENGGASRRQGVEVEVAMRVTPALRLSGDWTFQDARYTTDTYTEVDSVDGGSSVADLNGLRVFNTARYVGFATAEIAPPAARWTLRLTMNAMGPYSPFDEPGVVLPSWTLFSVTGVLRLGAAASLQVGVRNVFDLAYRELEAGGLITPGEPRAVYGALRYHL